MNASLNTSPALWVIALSVLLVTACDDPSSSTTDDAVSTEADAGPEDLSGDSVDGEPCSEEACGPAIGAPNYLCEDGITTAGPGPCERQEDGECGWTMVTCPEPEPCNEENCKSVPDTCEGTWFHPGWDQSCDEESGECLASTAEQPFDCAADGMVCVDGQCVEDDTDLCADVVCEPMESYCVSDTEVFGGGLTVCQPETGECLGEGMPLDCGAFFEGGICVDGACVEGDKYNCDELNCTVEDQAYCEGNIANTTNGEGYCDADWGCYWDPMQSEDCEAQGLICVDGACVEGGDDLCAEVVCENGPSYCDGNTAVYGGIYTCNPENGECGISVAEGPEDCAEIGLVCVDGACVEGQQGLCAAVACPSTPPFCEGSVAHSGTYQECDPQTGECIMAPGLPPQYCAEQGMVCLEGQCQDPQCTEADCGPMPGMPNTLCDDGVTTAGPSDCEMQDDGACGWTIIECPDAETCTPGESIEAGDGCNTCFCAESGLVSESFNCSKKACVCQTSKECHDGFFCDFPNDDCGIWGSTGNCAALPEACDDGGVGACGCGPVSTTNACEQQAMGYDVFTYGGCTLGSEETFACGDTTCLAESEMCSISMNDVMGPDQPLFFNNCGALAEDCGQGDCGCMTVDPWMSCYDETGYTLVFYMGG